MVRIRKSAGSSPLSSAAWQKIRGRLSPCACRPTELEGGKMKIKIIGRKFKPVGPPDVTFEETLDEPSPTELGSIVLVGLAKSDFLRVTKESGSGISEQIR